MDTARVEISIAPFEQTPTHWTPFDIRLRDGDLREKMVRQAAHPPLYGWWHSQEGFVLTLAAVSNTRPDEIPLHARSGSGDSRRFA